MSKLEKISIRIHPEDRETLQKFYPNMSYQKIMRHIIHRACRLLEEKDSQTRPDLDTYLTEETYD